MQNASVRSRSWRVNSQRLHSGRRGSQARFKIPFEDDAVGAIDVEFAPDELEVDVEGIRWRVAGLIVSEGVDGQRSFRK